MLVAVLALGAWLISNTLDNLARRGIASGLDFLGTSAGFGIAQSLIDYSEASSFGRAFLVGLLNTLLVSAIGIAIATALGFAIGMARLSSNWLVARLAGAYVETLRNIPLLLQIFFWYFAVLRALPAPRQSFDVGGAIFLNNRGLFLPTMEAGGEMFLIVPVGLLCLLGMIVGFVTGPRSPGAPRLRRVSSIGVAVAIAALITTSRWHLPELRGFSFTGGIVVMPELVALVVALATYTAAFIAEIVRAGIQAVPRGQVEAAHALALPRPDVMRLVIVPQAMRLIVPPLTNQYLNLTKNSSLAAAIAYPDLVSVFAGTVLNITGQAVEVIAITMAVYLAISLAIAGTMNLYNRTVALRGT